MRKIELTMEDWNENVSNRVMSKEDLINFIIRNNISDYLPWGRVINNFSLSELYKILEHYIYVHETILKCEEDFLL